MMLQYISKEESDGGACILYPIFQLFSEMWMHFVIFFVTNMSNKINRLTFNKNHSRQKGIIQYIIQDICKVKNRLINAKNNRIFKKKENQEMNAQIRGIPLSFLSTRIIRDHDVLFAATIPFVSLSLKIINRILAF